jgi:hypothetical protein
LLRGSNMTKGRASGYFAVSIIITCVVTITTRGSTKVELANEPTQLLGGRLTVRVPREAKLLPMQQSIMAAEESAEESSRIMLDAGGEKMVLMAYELFALAGTDFDGAVSRVLGSKLGRIEGLKLASPLCGISFAPKETTRTGDANLMMGIYVAQGDGTVQLINFYLNPAAAKKADFYLALARKISATLAPGTRKLLKSAGKRHLMSYSNDEILATVPDGYVATMQSGVDFLVHRLTKLTRLGAPQCRLGLYLGEYPSFNPERNAAVKQFKKSQATLLGHQVEWYQSSQKFEFGEVISTQALVPIHDASGKPFYAHFFLDSGSLEEAEELKQIASSLKLIRKTTAK